MDDRLFGLFQHLFVPFPFLFPEESLVCSDSGPSGIDSDKDSSSSESFRVLVALVYLWQAFHCIEGINGNVFGKTLWKFIVKCPIFPVVTTFVDCGPQLLFALTRVSPRFLVHCSPVTCRPEVVVNCCSIFSNTSFLMAFPAASACDHSRWWWEA